MIKFVLRLFVVLAVGFVISNEVVDRSANYLFEPVSDAYTRESVRGQIHSLVQELSKVEPGARTAYIEKQLLPYYGPVSYTHLEAGLVMQPLYDEPFVVAVPQDHELAQRVSIDAQDLKQQTLSLIHI